ncbi:MAG: two-component system sensor histidine kinase/response regulator [Gammaproteobacteria bacterium]|jgi:two-component system sensor histidine kinase/response regulator
MKAVNILLVDDQPANLLALEATLESPELNLVRANSGQEALSKIRKQDFAVVLLDVQMPEMDGYEVARQMGDNDLSSEIPIIFLTAYNIEEIQEFEGYETGGVDYLIKPIDTRILKKKVNIFADLKRKSEALEQALGASKEYAEELERFAFISSLDLQSPLRNIEHLSQWIVEETGDKLSGKALEYLDMLTSRVVRMGNMIDDLLKYTRVGYEKNATHLVDVNLLVDEVLELLFIPDGFTVTVDPDLPTFEAPKPLLKTILLNLVSNAVKHHHNCSKGKINISCHKVDDGKVYEFIVSDNGPGVESKYHDKIFDMFETLKPLGKNAESSGMGLSLVKKIVTKHGGAVVIKSEPGAGASFHIIWPVNTIQAMN